MVSQTLVSYHYSLNDGKLEGHAIPFRYVWPAELDLMARLAGMMLRERWGSWKREPFTRYSTEHISVWEKSAGSQDRPRYVAAQREFESHHAGSPRSRGGVRLAPTMGSRRLFFVRTSGRSDISWDAGCAAARSRNLTERREHQDNSHVYQQALPEPVPEEQNIHADHDGYQCEHV